MNSNRVLLSLAFVPISLVNALAVILLAAYVTACGPASAGTGGDSRADTLAPPAPTAPIDSGLPKPPTLATSIALHVTIGDAGESVLPAGTDVDAPVAASDRVAFVGVASSTQGLTRIELRGDVTTVCVRTGDGGVDEEWSVAFDLYGPDSAPDAGVATTRSASATFDIAPFATCLPGWRLARLDGTMQAIAFGKTVDDVSSSGIFTLRLP